jgi:hypothetical protein
MQDRLFAGLVQLENDSASIATTVSINSTEVCRAVQIPGGVPDKGASYWFLSVGAV